MLAACAAAGIRSNAGHLVLAYMPPFQQAVFPVSTSTCQCHALEGHL